MAVYKISIYSSNTPTVIAMSDIMSISTDEEVSVLGDELTVATMEVVVRYTSDADDITNLPYGTKVTLEIDYDGSGLIWYWNGTYYIETVERVSKYNYQINCISKIGLWEHQYTNGGLFNGTTLSNLVSTIFNDSEVSVHSGVSNLTVYGWIPHCTKREAMQQILFATGTYINATNTGYSIRNFYNTGSAIAAQDVYMSGSVEYPSIPSKVTVTEHGYYYLEGRTAEELFNNVDGYPANGLLVEFPNAPIYIPSIVATDGLTISNVTVNTCIVSGNGKITGIPYIHKEYDVVISNPSASAISREISVKDATLVSILNSEAVAQRVYDFNSQAIKSNIDFKYDNQYAGRYYNYYDAFSDLNNGCLAKIRKTYSTFVRASSEFVTGYEQTAENTGNKFSNFVVLITTSSATWYKPSGVTKIRVVLIGGGSGGSSGIAGQDGGAEYSGRGGRGGKAGTAGKGGKIFQTTITNPANTYSYRCGVGGNGGALCYSTETANSGNVGGDTVFGNFSTENGIYSDSGFCNLLSGIIYALPGGKGVNGGDGGDGGSNSTGVGDDNARNGKNGEDVIALDGTTMSGGSGGTGFLLASARVSDKCFASGGAGGNGACATSNGGAGTNGTVVRDWDDGIGEMNISTGGNGSTVRSTPSNRDNATIYGQGGDAGHGGGGGGAAGAETSDIYWYNTVNYVICSPNGEQVNGNGGYGGAGGKGANGCIIIYY